MSSILLINARPTRKLPRPELDPRVESYFDALAARGPKLGDTRTEPNNGLLIIGHCLKSQGHEVTYLDLSVQDYLTYERTGNFLSFEAMAAITAAAAKEADFLLFSAIIVGIDDCLRLMDELKTQYPEKIFFLGGTFPSLKPDYCLQNCRAIDALVIGEGEEITGAMVTAYARRDFSKLHTKKGIIFREQAGAAYHSYPGYNLADLTALRELATPDWDLLDPASGPHVYRTVSARGCGFRCSFCVPSHLSAHRVRSHPQDVFIDSVRRIRDRHQAASYVIGDLTFLFDQDHSRAILKGLIADGISTPFWCQTHLSRITAENLELLKAAGCCQIAVGIESINPSILANINKGVNEREIVQKLMLIKEYGIEVQTYFIIGLPGDDLDTIRLNKRFMEYGVASGLIDRTHIGIYVPYPGPHMNEAATIESNDYSKYTQGVFRDIPTAAVYSTELLSSAQIEEAYADTLGSVGAAFKNRKELGQAALQEEAGIILGAEVLNIAQKMRKLAHSANKRLVFNIVQGVRPESQAFISDNIQEVGDIVFANAEFYAADQLGPIINELLTCVDIFLVDADMKSPQSAAVVAACREAIPGDKLLFYGDTLSWVRAVLNIVLWSAGFDLADKHVYLSPKNKHVAQLGSMLSNFTPTLYGDKDRLAADAIDIAISFGLDGTLMGPEIIDCMKPGGVIIDAALGSLAPELYAGAQTKDITILRPDMRIVIASEVLMGLGHGSFYRDTVGRKETGSVVFISGGIVGRPGDVVVDCISRPTQIIGLADGQGRLIPRHLLDQGHREILIKADRILKEKKGAL